MASAINAVAQIIVGNSQLMESLTHTPPVHGFWLVILQELRPGGGIARMTNGERCKDGDADGIGYLVTLPKPTVFPADR